MLLILMVGAEGFEPPTLCSQSASPASSTDWTYLPASALSCSNVNEYAGLRHLALAPEWSALPWLYP